MLFFLSLFALIPLYFAFRICRNYKDAFWIGVIQTTTYDGATVRANIYLGYKKDDKATSTEITQRSVELKDGNVSPNLQMSMRIIRMKN